MNAPNLRKISGNGQWSAESLEIDPGDRERIRIAIWEQILVALEGTKLAPLVNVARTRELARIDQRKAAKVVRDWKAGRAQSLLVGWGAADSRPSAAREAVTEPGDEDESGEPGEPCESQPLAGLLRRAITDGDRERAALELAAQVASGEVTDSQARAIQSALGEARHAAQKKRENEPPPEDPTKFLLASAEAMKAARAIDWIVDDERRDRVLAIVAAELEADVVACPNVDEGST